MCESATPLFLGKIEWVLLPLGKYYPPVFGQNKGLTLHPTTMQNQDWQQSNSRSAGRLVVYYSDFT
jgi:hypothetical protein